MRKYFNNILISGLPLFLLVSGSLTGLPSNDMVIHESDLKTPVKASQEPIKAIEQPIEPTITDILEKYDWNVEVALEVIKEESHFKKEAYNPEWHNGCQGSVGLFQIACVNYQGDLEDLYNIKINVKTAYEVYKTQGSDAWGVCTDGKVDCSDW